MRFIAAACLAALLLAGASHAQTYPSANVRIVVPYPAGGPTDIIARLCAQKLSEALGHQFYVENVSGASGARGAAMVAGAPADGYTLLFVTNDLAVTSVISTKIQYDPIKSFAPVGLVSASPSVVLVHPSVPAKTMQEFIALARADPGKIQLRLDEPRPEPAHQRAAVSSRAEPADHPGPLPGRRAHPHLDRRRPHAGGLHRPAGGNPAHQGRHLARAGGHQLQALSDRARGADHGRERPSATRKPS